ncbi:MAG TPA: luciferase family protein [Candidatus Angelobacter sp.]
MKQWSALLEAELSNWPAVTTRRMFGMLAFYRKGKIFAALPRTRCFETPRSVAFKLDPMTPRTVKLLQADARIPSTREESRWISFELSSPADLNDALKWFDLAYRTCLSKNNSKS